MSVHHHIRLLHQRILVPALNLVFPPVCVSCERVGSLLCSHCRAAFNTPPPRALPPLQEVRSLGTFEGALQTAVHHLKYDSLAGLAAPLGQEMAAAIRAAGWPEGVLLAVPLHENRQQARGYNQAALLAAAAAGALGWPLREGLLLRTRDTPTQVGLNRQQRQANMAGAFTVRDAAALRGQAVVLVDDVLTTGATLRACAEALLAAGAASIRAVTAGQAAVSWQDAAPARAM